LNDEFVIFHHLHHVLREHVQIFSADGRSAGVGMHMKSIQNQRPPTLLDLCHREYGPCRGLNADGNHLAGREFIPEIERYLLGLPLHLYTPLTG